RLRRVYGGLLERLRGVPGVRAVSLAGATPLNDETLQPEVRVAGYMPRAAEDMHVRLMQIYPDYFAALGVPVVAGRELTVADGDPTTLAAPVRQLAREVEPAMAMLQVETLADRVEGATRQERLVALLSSVFGAVALTLAALGLYGVLAYAVARRQTEFGIRM